MTETMTASLSPLDFIILTVIFISTVISLMRGFTKEMLSIIGWILAIYGTAFSLPLIRPLAQEYIAPDWLADGLVMLVIFVLILGVFSFVSNRFSKKLKDSSIGFIDRILGVVFGVGRGLLIIVFAYFVILLLLPLENHPDWLKKGQLIGIVQKITPAIMQIVPIDNLSDRIPQIESKFNSPINDNLFNSTTDKLESSGYKQDMQENVQKLLHQFDE